MQAQLVELGGVLLHVELAAQVDAGVAGLDEAVSLDDRRLQHLGAGDVAGQAVGPRRRQGVVLAAVLQLAVEGVEAELQPLAGVVLQGQGGPEPGAVVVPGGIGVGLRGEHAGGVGGGQPRRVGCADAGADVGRIDVDLAPAEAAVAELVGVGLAIGHREQGAEVAPAVGDQSDQPRRGLVGVAVGLGLGGEHGLEARVVEGPGRIQLHGAADAALVQLGRIGLLHRHLVEQLRGEQAVVEAAGPAHAAAVVHPRGGVAQHLHAVELGAGEVGTEAAKRDLTALAGIPRDGDPRDALQRLGKVEVRKGGDVLGDDDVHRSRRVPLDVARVGQAVAEAGDHHFIDARRAVRHGVGGPGLRRQADGQAHGQRRRGHPVRFRRSRHALVPHVAAIRRPRSIGSAVLRGSVGAAERGQPRGHLACELFLTASVSDYVESDSRGLRTC